MRRFLVLAAAALVAGVVQARAEGIAVSQSTGAQVVPAQAPTISAARNQSGILLLSDGRVFYVGGEACPSTFTTAEVWSPKTNAWSSAGDMSVARDPDFITQLADGRVMIVGGCNCPNTIDSNAVDFWNPSTGAWTTGAVLPTGSCQGGGIVQTATTTTGVAGDIWFASGTAGVLGTNPPAAYSYSVAGNSWSTLAAAPAGTAPAEFGLFLVSSTQVYLAGGGTYYLGASATYNTTTRIYDLNAQTWSAGNPLPLGVGTMTFDSCVKLHDGREFCAGSTATGGATESSAGVLYSGGTWTQVTAGVALPSNLPHPTAKCLNCTTLLMPSGRAIVLGFDSVVAGVGMLDPLVSPPTWYSAASMQTARAAAAGLVMPDGRALVCGGFSILGDPSTNTCEFYDERTNVWSP